MKRFHVVKGIAMSVFVMALLMGFSAPANAKVQKAEVTNQGATKAPTIAIKNTKQTGDLVTAWTISFPEIPEGCEMYFNLYDDDKMDSLTGEWITDVSGKECFKAWYYSAHEGDKEFVFQNNGLTMGKKTLEAYFYDAVAYEEAIAEYWAECDRIDDEYTRLENQYWIDKGIYDRDIDLYNRLWQEYREKLAAYERGETWMELPIVPPTMEKPIEPEKPVKEPYPTEPAKSDYLSPAANTLKLDVKKVARCSTSVTSTSVEIRMTDDYVTGYEIYRKIGGKFKKIGKVAKNVFMDKGLTSKTKYTYKVRPYYFDKKHNKTIYGIYCQFDTMTIGSPLKLKASISGSKNVKLTWAKIKGATKYEIYRSVNWSEDSEISKGWGNRYGAAELIKTVSKSKKSFTDKKTVKSQSYNYTVVAVLSAGKKVNVTDSVGVSLGFGTPVKVTQYVDKNGKKTVEWQKVIGAEGYIVEKMQQDKKTGEIVWKEVKKLSKSATKTSFDAPKMSADKNGDWTTVDKDGNWIIHDYYRIYAYKSKGKVISSEYMPIRVDSTIGVVSNVTAKKVANGIQVSWSKVDKAAYYKVYRLKTGALIKDKDNGSYTLSHPGYNNGEDITYGNFRDSQVVGCYFTGRQVTEYVGAAAPVQVDVKKWNEAVLNYQKDPEHAEKPAWDYMLDPEKTYYYQNYQYSQNKFTGTSMIDYSGDIYSCLRNVDYEGNRTAGVFEDENSYKTREFEIDPKADYHVGPEEGISYQYYVVAVMAEEKELKDYDGRRWDIDGKEYYDEELAKERYEADRVIYAAVPGTTEVKKLNVVKPIWKAETGHSIYSLGCKKVGTATFKEITPPKKTSIKSIKAGKKKATISFKKVTGATEYKIYRASKKKGPFTCVGTTSKTKFTDTGLKSRTTYYYRIVVIKANGVKADVTSAPSKVKSVKVK